MFGRLGIVHRANGLAARHQVQFAQQMLRQRLGQRLVMQQTEYRLDPLLHHTRVHASPLNLLGHAVIGAQASGTGVHSIPHAQLRELGVGYVETVTKDGRLSKNDVFGILLIGFLNVLQTIEPHKVNDSVPVRKVRHDATFASDAFLFERENLATHLHIRHVGSKFVAIVKTTAVDVLRGELHEQVAIGRNPHVLL